jgi:hypothetical protein
MDFEHQQALYKQEKFNELTTTNEGRRFLKLKSFHRPQYLENFLEKNGISFKKLKKKEFLKTAFDLDIKVSEIDLFIKSQYKIERDLRKKEEENLFLELNKLESFDWGGFNNGDLEGGIITNYINKIDSYDLIKKKISDELNHKIQNYILCCWFNHWTSTIIEDVFKDHPRVIPAIGRVKKIDFFIDGVPFDLKVTYLPEEFIKTKRKNAELKPEFTILKKSAKKFEISLEEKILKEKEKEKYLWNKHIEHPNPKAKEIINEFIEFRKKIIEEVEKNPDEVINFLYEKQGVRRFDASNRLFLLLIDTKNFEESWKMKRNIPVIQKSIKKFLDDNKNIGRDISFVWQEGQQFKVKSDLLIIKN